MNQIAYLDNAATTKLDPKVLEAMIPYMEQFYGNPSSSYSLGRQSRSAIEAARSRVGEMLGVKATTIYFTSGGTESNNTAIASAIHKLESDAIEENEDKNDQGNYSINSQVEFINEF